VKGVEQKLQAIMSFVDTRGWTLDQISEEIARWDVSYKELEEDALAETDPLAFQKKAFKLSSVRDTLLSLESQRSVMLYSNQCLAKMLGFLEDHKKSMSEEIHRLECRITQMEETTKPAPRSEAEVLISDYDSLKKEMQRLQLSLDAVDNRTRA
jgi:hypothetical protein